MAEPKIWMNGKLVTQAEAVLPVNSAAVFYATNVFEGLRAYWNETDDQLYCFRLDEHFARFRESMKMMRFTVPYSDADLYAAVKRSSPATPSARTSTCTSWPTWPARAWKRRRPPGSTSIPAGAGASTEESGLRCCISSWARTSDNAIPIRLKCGANYQNGRLAALQAKADGYDAPIFLNQLGRVAEGTGATFFMVRKGQIVTPPVTSDILESITRTTLIEKLCPELIGMQVVEREIARTELYVAEEAFFCGSGYEITPITSIDRFPLGDGHVGADHAEALDGVHEHRPRNRQALPGMAHARLSQAGKGLAASRRAHLLCRRPRPHDRGRNATPRVRSSGAVLHLPPPPLRRISQTSSVDLHDQTVAPAVLFLGERLNLSP